MKSKSYYNQQNDTFNYRGIRNAFGANTNLTQSNTNQQKVTFSPKRIVVIQMKPHIMLEYN